MILLLLYFWIFIVELPHVETRELMIQRACQLNPDFSFCRKHISTTKIRTESEKKHDVFLRWAYVSAKDAQDIEDVDELETTRKTAYSIPDYCKKYADNFKSYCTNGHLEILEGLLAQFCGSYAKNCDAVGKGKVTKIGSGQPEEIFPTPKPFFTTSTSTTVTPKVSYCDGNSERYRKECEKDGFTPEVFCRKYKERCGKLEKVDASTTKSVVDDEDSLETPEEFQKKEQKEKSAPSEKIPEKSEETEEIKPEGEGAGNDEVTAYCTNYIENYNFYCVGDMSPEHEKFCNSYKKNCPDRVS